jgi:hypothetical protein
MAFPLFSRLPTELRTQIWQQSMPRTTTLHIQEGADIDITAVSSPPGQALACKEARAAYLSAGFKTYSIYTVEDWTDIHINEDTTLQLIITPPHKPSKNLNITWTELGTVLGDALKVIKHLRIVCKEPERLVRLWCAGEAGLVCPGETHWGGYLWNKDTITSDRDVRGWMRPDITVSVSTSESSQEVIATYELVQERIVDDSSFSTTNILRLISSDDEFESRQEVAAWENFVAECQEESQGDALTEKAVAQFIQETGWTPRSSTPSSVYTGEEMFYDGELWLTMA